jgi:hypothetical protein
VSDYTHGVLGRVRDAGVPVVGATGRGPRLLDLTRRDLPSAGHLVLGGGGQVVDLIDPEAPVVLHDRRLPGPVAAVLVEELEAVAGPLIVMVEALDHPYAPLWGDLDPHWPWRVGVEAVSRERALAGDVVKVIVRADGMGGDALVELARQVVPESSASLTQAGRDFVDITPPGVDKATGLEVVVAALGVDRADVLVFGDMPNDVPMFAWAGWGRVAVANAHPGVLALADETTLSNDQDGVAVWLDRLLSRAR